MRENVKWPVPDPLNAAKNIVEHAKAEAGIDIEASGSAPVASRQMLRER